MTSIRFASVSAAAGVAALLGGLALAPTADAAPVAPVAPVAADAPVAVQNMKKARSSDYRWPNGIVYFRSPSTNFDCAIMVPATDKGEPNVGCHGPIARSMKGWTRDTNSVVASRAVRGRITTWNDPAFLPMRHGNWARAKVLPYNTLLAVSGDTRCWVTPKGGVECKTGKHGFRMSSTSGRTW